MKTYSPNVWWAMALIAFALFLWAHHEEQKLELEREKAYIASGYCKTGGWFPRWEKCK